MYFGITVSDTHLLLEQRIHYQASYSGFFGQNRQVKVKVKVNFFINSLTSRHGNYSNRKLDVSEPRLSDRLRAIQ
jgi:hypothetical protein